MVKPAECRLMRDIMKSTAKKMAVVLSRILIFCLGVLLFLHVSEITLKFFSRQEFIKYYGMFYVIAGLCVFNIVISIFFYWCAFIAGSATKDKSAVSDGFKPTNIFLVFGVFFSSIPILISCVLYVFASYLPGCNLPEGLKCGMHFSFSVGLVILFLLAWYFLDSLSDAAASRHH